MCSVSYKQKATERPPIPPLRGIKGGVVFCGGATPSDPATETEFYCTHSGVLLPFVHPLSYRYLAPLGPYSASTAVLSRRFWFLWKLEGLTSPVMLPKNHGVILQLRPCDFARENRLSGIPPTEKQMSTIKTTLFFYLKRVLYNCEKLALFNLLFTEKIKTSNPTT